MPAGEFSPRKALFWRWLAARRGETADRYIPREPGDVWPRLEWVDRNSPCSKSPLIPAWHDGGETCRYCGAFVT